jgi:hypothetical protein
VYARLAIKQLPKSKREENEMVKGITGGKNPIEFYVDDDDAFLLRLKWSASYRRNKTLMAIGSGIKFHDGIWKTVLLHRIIMKQPNGNGMVVDHIDGNPANNSKDNLRVCTQSDNSKNRSKSRNNKTGFKGVCWDKKAEKYRARIIVEYNQISLGCYDTSEEAHEAYKQAAVKHFGEFSRFD